MSFDSGAYIIAATGKGGDRTPVPSPDTNAVTPTAAAGAQDPTEKTRAICAICRKVIAQLSGIMGHLADEGRIPHFFHASCLQPDQSPCCCPICRKGSTQDTVEDQPGPAPGYGHATVLEPLKLQPLGDSIYVVGSSGASGSSFKEKFVVIKDGQVEIRASSSYQPDPSGHRYMPY